MCITQNTLIDIEMSWYDHNAQTQIPLLILSNLLILYYSLLLLL